MNVRDATSLRAAAVLAVGGTDDEPAQPNGIDPTGGTGSSARRSPLVTGRSYTTRFRAQHIEPAWRAGKDFQGNQATAYQWSSALGLVLSGSTDLTYPTHYVYLASELAQNGNALVLGLPGPAPLHVFARLRFNALGDVLGYSASFDGTTYGLWRWDGGGPVLLSSAAPGGTPDWWAIQTNGSSIIGVARIGGLSSTFAFATDLTYLSAGYVGVGSDGPASVSFFDWANFDGL